MAELQQQLLGHQHHRKSAPKIGINLIARMKQLLAPNAASASQADPESRKPTISDFGDFGEEILKRDSLRSQATDTQKRASEFKSTSQDSDSEDSDDSDDSCTKSLKAEKKRIVSAIHEHTNVRKRAIVRGKLLRCMRRGLRPEGANGLSREDLRLLNMHLPALEPSDDDDEDDGGSNEGSSSGRDSMGSRSVDDPFHLSRVSSADAGPSSRDTRGSRLVVGRPPMQDPSLPMQQAMQRKFKKLSAPSFGGVLPSL
jgi:hypothetical protein